LHFKKIKENSPTLWDNEHTHTLRRTAQQMERIWKKTKLEVFRILWKDSVTAYTKTLKTKLTRNKASTSDFSK